MIFEIQKDGKTSPKPVKTSSLTDEGWNEKDLENYLRDNLPKLISDDLMVIGQSRPYQPEADLIALDRQGDLWIFEVKKVATSSDNLLQVAVNQFYLNTYLALGPGYNISHLRRFAVAR